MAWSARMRCWSKSHLIPPMVRVLDDITVNLGRTSKTALRCVGADRCVCPASETRSCPWDDVTCPPLSIHRLLERQGRGPGRHIVCAYEVLCYCRNVRLGRPQLPEMGSAIYPVCPWLPTI